MKETTKQTQDRLAGEFAKRVVGKRIKRVYYDECSQPVFILENETEIAIQRDDENNGPGVPVHWGFEKDNEKEPVGMWEVRIYE
tara:strand:- start:582 stop:833 length:252 start_codon:yes stop_codon:yes gene_type:complete